MCVVREQPQDAAWPLPLSADKGFFFGRFGSVLSENFGWLVSKAEPTRPHKCHNGKEKKRRRGLWGGKKIGLYHSFPSRTNTRLFAVSNRRLLLVERDRRRPLRLLLLLMSMPKQLLLSSSWTIVKGQKHQVASVCPGHVTCTSSSYTWKIFAQYLIYRPPLSLRMDKRIKKNGGRNCDMREASCGVQYTGIVVHVGPE